MKAPDEWRPPGNPRRREPRGYSPKRPSTRKRVIVGPPWPWAYAVALAGKPIGVAYVPDWQYGCGSLVVVDPNGELFLLRGPRDNAEVLRWAVNRSLQLYHGIGALCDAVIAGIVLGWVHELCPYPVMALVLRAERAPS